MICIGFRFVMLAISASSFELTNFANSGILPVKLTIFGNCCIMDIFTKFGKFVMLTKLGKLVKFVNVSNVLDNCFVCSASFSDEKNSGGSNDLISNWRAPEPMIKSAFPEMTL